MEQRQKKDKRKNPSSGGSSAIPPHNSKAKIETISKYFTKTDLTVDSPFRNTLSTVELNVPSSDESDFKTPKPHNKIPKPFQPQKITKRKLRQKKLSSLIRSVEENFSHENVNSEHLQMALALSKSVNESVEHGNEEAYNAVYVSTQDKVKNVRKTLEEFGFKSGRTTTTATVDLQKKRKKSKFQYVTPILFMRTEDERQKIIANKISLILTENAQQNFEKPFKTDYNVSSEYLQTFYSKKSTILTLNSLESDELNHDRFYVKNLNLTPTSAKCGTLLKDWSSIAGREATPPKELPEKTVNEAKNTTHLQVTFKRRSISPDLFDSDEESERNVSLTKENNSAVRNYDRDQFVSAKQVILVEDGGNDIKTPLNLEKADFSTKRTSIDSGFVTDENREVTATTEIKETHKSDFLIEKKVSLKSNTQIDKITWTETKHQENKKSRKSDILIEKYLNKNDTDDDLELSLLSFKSSSQLSKNKTELNLNFLTNDQEELMQIGENGIRHFESFCKESEALSQECVDLTQSSDEENENQTIFTEIQLENGTNDTDLKSSTEKLISNSPEPYNNFQNMSCENKTVPDEDRAENLISNSPELHNSFQEMCYENKTNQELEPSSTFQMISFEETFRRESMNVTAYIHNILNQNDDQVEHENFNQSECNISFVKHPSIASNCSQESIYISDEEVNYSSVHANAKETSSSDDEIDLTQSKTKENLDRDPSSVQEAKQNIYENKINPTLKTNVSVTKADSYETNADDDEAIEQRAATPKPSFVVRTTNVTPIPDFDRMDTPKVATELKKFGVKAMKRKRGIQLLKYIYDATHPIIGEEQNENIVKKRKIVNDVLIVGDAIIENEPLDDLIFERKPSRKVHSCALPLQIAFHNLLSCNHEVREKILLYEPLHLEELYLLLKNQGFKYHIKDLLTFLDRKCVTVRTNHK